MHVTQNIFRPLLARSQAVHMAGLGLAGRLHLMVTTQNSV